MKQLTRRSFLSRTAMAVGGTAFACPSMVSRAADDIVGMQFGLVTYQWGKNMDLPTLLEVCDQSGIIGVELRTEHKHGVEPGLSKSQRQEVLQRFADSPVHLVGYGSNAQFHEADPAKVKANIELTKDYIRLMRDCGGTGVKVKPNGFSSELSREQTIEQIGKALNEVAAYGADFGQEIRVEVHGKGTSEIEVMKAIFDVADHENAKICWNSNGIDLEGQGLEANFNLLKDRFGATVHVRELDIGSYPYDQLMKLFLKMDYKGWILLEARTNPSDKVAALKQQLEVFEGLKG